MFYTFLCVVTYVTFFVLFITKAENICVGVYNHTLDIHNPDDVPSWVDDMDVLFSRTDDAFLSGDYEKASRAYSFLFSALHVAEDIAVEHKMYSAQDEKSFVTEAKWIPNSTFIFCGQQGKTWHSYESDQTEQRITLNLFLTKSNSKCFYRD